MFNNFIYNKKKKKNELVIFSSFLIKNYLGKPHETPLKLGFTTLFASIYLI